MIRLLLIISLWLIIMMQNIHPQQNSLWVAGMEIYLGMNKDDLLSKLNKETYSIQETPNSLFIYEKLDALNNPQKLKLVCCLSIIDGSVNSIQKEWGDYDESVLNSFNNLYKSLKKLISKDKENIQIELYEWSEPDIEGREISLIYKNHKIKINIFQHNLQLSEVLDLK